MGLIIDETKTEVMQFNIDPDTDNQCAKLQGKPLKIVKNFKYLGSQMESTVTDYQHRRGLAIRAYVCLNKIWQSKNTPLRLKVEIFQASVISILLYGCESWIVDNQLESEINTFAMACYRSFMGVKRLDRVPNDEILAKVKQPPLINQVRKRQLGWLGHTLRFDEKHDPAYTFALYTPEHGTNRRGRPTLTYKQQIANLICDSPELLTTEHIVELAKDKKQWRKRLAVFGSLEVDHR